MNDHDSMLIPCAVLLILCRIMIYFVFVNCGCVINNVMILNYNYLARDDNSSSICNDL